MINTDKLKGRISEKGFTMQGISKALGMSAYTFRRKIRNEVPMTINEADNLSEELDISKKEFPEFFLFKKLQNSNK